MIFEERQKNGKFYYQVEDVFGKMKFSSKTNLNAERLDQIFMAVFSIKSPAKSIVGEIKELGLKYKFVRKSQWSDPDKVEANRFATPDIKNQNKDLFL